MRTIDVQAGQLVLYNRLRLNNQNYSLFDCELAQVQATGVEHAYRVHAGGWSYRLEEKKTSQGIRLQVRRHDRASPLAIGEDRLLPALYEVVTIAPHLQPADGGDFEEWKARVRRQAETGRAGDEPLLEEVVDGLEAAGFVDAVAAGRRVSLSLEDGRRLLEWLRAGK